MHFMLGEFRATVVGKAVFLNLNKEKNKPEYFTWKLTIVIISREGKTRVAFRVGSQMLEKIQTWKKTECYTNAKQSSFLISRTVK